MPIKKPSNAENRPKAFDDMLMAHMPGLKKLSGKYARGTDERTDLVTDTVARALHRWQSFRPDGGFWSWLVFTMRGVAADKRKAIKSRPVLTFTDKTFFTGAVEANQEEAAYLGQVMRALDAHRHGKQLARRAMGDSFSAVAAADGTSTERARQKIEGARADMRREFGVAAWR